MSPEQSPAATVLAASNLLMDRSTGSVGRAAEEDRALSVLLNTIGIEMRFEFATVDRHGVVWGAFKARPVWTAAYQLARHVLGMEVGAS